MIFPLFPLLMLVTTFASIWLYLRTNNDIFGVLGLVMAIACLIWGLIVAHWSIHLLALLSLLTLRKPKAIAKVVATLK